MPRAIPRFELSVKSAEECNVPPFNVKCPAVAEPGAAPNPLSAPIVIVPALIVVDPEYVLVPDKVKVPEPALAKLPDQLITPEIVSLPVSPVVNVIPLASSILPAPLKD